METLIVNDSDRKIWLKLGVQPDVMAMLVEWYVDVNSFDGETLSQDDESIINSPIILSEIAEKIFKVEYK